MARQHRDIIRSLGGASAISRALGRGKGTVGSWRDRDSIPADHWPALIELAATLGVELSVADLLSGQRPRKPYERKDDAKCGHAQGSSAKAADRGEDVTTAAAA